MKKNYLNLLTLFILILPGIIHAQMPAAGVLSGGSIKGTLTDSLSGETLGYVSVSLQRKNFRKIINGAISDEKGKFSLDNIPAGKYTLKFVFVGYETKIVNDIEIPADNQIKNLGTIPIAPSASLLKEIEINARKNLIEQKVDRLVYNVDRDKTAPNQTLNELMRKVPMVEVDAEGNLSLRGNRNIQVLINGKPSGVFASNMADALRTIPAEHVARVEIITMPSARYDAEGTAGIINIITKKKQIEGYNGSINLAGSNINNNSSASLHLRTARIGVNAMIGLNGMLPQHLHNSLTRTATTETGATLLTQQGAATADRIAGTSQIGIDYDPNLQNSCSSSLRWSDSRVTADGLIQVHQIDDAGIENRFNRSLGNSRKDYNLEWTTDYRHTFRNPQQQWSASVQWARLHNRQDFTQIEQPLYVTEISIGENGLNRAANEEITAQTDYSQTFKNNIQLETGAKHIARFIQSESWYKEWEPDRSGFFLNPERSQQLDYTQRITAAYLEMRFQWNKKWSLRVGNRVETTMNNFQNLSGNPIRNNYFTWAPGTALSYTFKNAATITGSYSRRIQRPGIAQLNPFVNAADRYNVTLGNPYLQPELTDILDINFALPFKKGFLNGSVFYYHTSDIIEKLTTIDENGIASSIQQNLGVSQLAGGNAYLTYQLTNIWSVRGGVNTGYVIANNSLNINGVGNRGVQLNTFLMNDLEFKKGFSLEMLGAYAAPTLSVQGKSLEFYTLQLSASQEILHKKGAVTLVVVNPFRHEVAYGTRLEGPGFTHSKTTYVPFRMVSAGFSYRFGKAGSLKQMVQKKLVRNTDLKEAEKEQL